MKDTTGGFNVVSKLSSLTTLTSERKLYFKDGYKIHHVSVAGRCLVADAINAAAPLNCTLDGKALCKNLTQTLSNPSIRME